METTDEKPQKNSIAEDLSNWDEEIETFDDMNVRAELLRGIFAYGFAKPTVIQQKAIKPMLMGRDLIVQAHSGSGKTTASLIGALQKIDIAVQSCQVVILTPTRELSQSTQRAIMSIGDYMQPQCHACTGGDDVREENRKLECGMHIVLGTPGRVLDKVNHRALGLDTTKLFILDEADEMLSRGFKDQINEIFRLLPSTVQVGLLTATMTSDVLELTQNFMREPVCISIKPTHELTLESIRQFYIAVDREEWKLETLCELYETVAIMQAIVFCNTSRKVAWLTDQLRSKEIIASAIHNDMNMTEREISRKEFVSGNSLILVTTDVLDRPVDLQQVSLVINYDLASNNESYIRRIGRSGKFGRRALAINFVTTDERQALRGIEQYFNTSIDELPMNVADLI